MHATGNSEQNADYYSEIYRSGYDTSGYQPLYQLVLKMLKDFSSPRILELGCGIGDLGRMIIDEGYPYRGFDFSMEAVAQCKERCPWGTFVLGDVYKPEDYLPLNYNVVIALEVLEHVDDLKVIDHIPPGARLIASVPDYDDLSHLRLYKDIQTDIIERFRASLHVVDVTTASFENASSVAKQSIHILSGIKLLTQSPDE